MFRNMAFAAMSFMALASSSMGIRLSPTQATHAGCCKIQTCCLKNSTAACVEACKTTEGCMKGCKDGTCKACCFGCCDSNCGGK
jgi:hypothetical protein